MSRLWLIPVALLHATCFADQWFASSDGSGSAAGTIQDPLDLVSGLDRLRPGDTLYLRKGVYSTRSGIWISRGGTADAPVVIRNYNGESVRIVGGDGEGVVMVSGQYVWLWGLEIYSASPLRISAEAGAYPSDIRRMTAVGTTQRPGSGVGLRIINCILHDGFNGVALWQEAEDSELYGNLIYNNGWEGTDKGWNHGVYTQNRNGTKRFVDNVIFNQFSHGIHAYGSENSFLDNFWLEGNVIFDNGELSVNEGYTRNILVGGGRTAQNPVLIDNYTYYPPSARDGSNDVGYAAGCENLRATGNYFVGPVALRLNCNSGTVERNTFYGETRGFSASQYPQNQYVSSRPGENWVFVRPNTYEPGRGHVVVYNWKRLPSVSVDISTVVRRGTVYTVRDAQDIFGQPLAFGVYMGGEIAIPMTSRGVTQPVGEVPQSPRHTDTEFGVFVIQTLGGSAASRAGVDREPKPPALPAARSVTAGRKKDRL